VKTVRPLKKLVMLAPASVIHTQRWATALEARGLEVVLATQHPAPDWPLPAGLRVVVLPHQGMAGYFRNVPALRALLRAERPELLQAHYASGYGTTAALAGFRPWLLSVWGSDVYDFPYEGALKGWWLRRNLKRADAIAATSQAMAQQVRRLLPGVGEVAVTPFGIDTTRFEPRPEAHAGLVIGTVKTLAPKYGIDVLLRAFARLADLPGLSLLIVGGGPQRAELEALATDLGIAAQVHFVGAVAHDEVPRWLNRLDIYVAASRLDSESFGVAVLEASACEVVADGHTGLVVPRDDPEALATALRRLVADPALRRALGRAGRQRVQQHYEWSHSVDHMLRTLEAAARQVES
jgi:L-malate glycosyltransferase